MSLFLQPYSVQFACSNCGSIIIEIVPVAELIGKSLRYDVAPCKCKISYRFDDIHQLVDLLNFMMPWGWHTFRCEYNIRSF